MENLKYAAVLVLSCVMICSYTAFVFYVGRKTSGSRYIHVLENHIVRQDSLIIKLRTERDSLRITRTEFDEAVKLLERKKQTSWK